MLVNVVLEINIENKTKTKLRSEEERVIVYIPYR